MGNRERGKVLSSKFKKITAKKPNQDTQFNVPQKVAQSKKVSHKQVFGGRGGVQGGKARSKKARLQTSQTLT